MRNTLSFVTLHRIFTAVFAIIVGGFLAFVAYLYFTFNGILTGDVRVELTPDLLANLQTQRFDAAVSRMETRRNLPDLPADLPDAFDAPSD